MTKKTLNSKVVRAGAILSALLMVLLPSTGIGNFASVANAVTNDQDTSLSTFTVDGTAVTDGAVVDGTTQITIEPRAKYTISNRVTASAFVKYEGNFSEGAANPGFSTTQVGLDIRLSISGGR